MARFGRYATYLRNIAVPFAQKLLVFSTVALVSNSVAPISTLGQPREGLLATAALLLGARHASLEYFI